MMENQTNQMLPEDLDKCAECKRPFSKGQEYWELRYQGKACRNQCLTCWDKWATEKKVWKK